MDNKFHKSPSEVQGKQKFKIDLKKAYMLLMQLICINVGYIWDVRHTSSVFSTIFNVSNTLILKYASDMTTVVVYPWNLITANLH